MGALSHINQYFWKYKWLLILGIIFTLFSNFFGVFPAQLVRYALDLVTETIDIYFLFKGFNRGLNVNSSNPGINKRLEKENLLCVGKILSKLHKRLAT